MRRPTLSQFNTNGKHDNPKRKEQTQHPVTLATTKNSNAIMRGFCQSHLLPPQDKDDIYLAHQYRLSLPSRPTQSSFRVLALLFFEQIITEDEDNCCNDGPSSISNNLPPWVRKRTSDGRQFIVGTNDEPGYMGGAICAERAAMVQLRFLSQYVVTKLVIATDCIDPISPGMLCREFMAGHPNVPMDLRIICAGSRCTRCHLTEDDLFPVARQYIRSFHMGNTDQDQGNRFLIPSHVECGDGRTEYSLPTLVTSLTELYTYPSPYTRLTAAQSVALGEAYSDSEYSERDLDGLPPIAKRLFELAVLEAKQQLTTSRNGTTVHPIQFGAAVMLEDGTIVTSHQSSALEYGCTLDAVSQLVPNLEDETGCAPVLLVQADQYGIAHAPFAPARSFLSEYGYGECRVLLHHHRQGRDDDHNNKTTLDHPSFDKLFLQEVRVADLAPNAPAWIADTDEGMDENDTDIVVMTDLPNSRLSVTTPTNSDDSTTVSNPPVEKDDDDNDNNNNKSDNINSPQEPPRTPGENSFHDVTSNHENDIVVVASTQDSHYDEQMMMPADSLISDNDDRQNDKAT